MQSLILYLLFFSLPFQTRILLFQGPDEYQSLFLYGTDLLIGLLFIWWGFSVFRSSTFKRSLFSFISRYRMLLTPTGFFVGWLLLASVVSGQVLVGLYQTIKVIEFLWLFYYVISLAYPTFRNVLVAFVGGAMVQGIIAIVQFIIQRDVGLRLLGENILTPHLPGVAKLSIAGENIIRAYGTLPHPNVLATFLFFSLVALFFLVLRESEKHYLKRASLFIFLLLMVGFFLTFSRVPLFFGVLSILLWLALSYRMDKRRLKPYLILFLGSVVVLGVFFFPHFKSRLSLKPDDPAISLRIFYTKTAFEAIREHPIIGVGPGQFTSFQQPFIEARRLPAWANQPVHNIYILLAAEAGLLALFFFFWFLRNLARFSFQGRNRLFVLQYSLFPFAILMIGSFDHFFLTFHQGGLIFWFSLAFFVHFSRLEKAFR